MDRTRVKPDSLLSDLDYIVELDPCIDLAAFPRATMLHRWRSDHAIVPASPRRGLPTVPTFGPIRIGPLMLILTTCMPHSPVIADEPRGLCSTTRWCSCSRPRSADCSCSMWRCPRWRRGRLACCRQASSAVWPTTSAILAASM